MFCFQLYQAFDKTQLQIISQDDFPSLYHSVRDEKKSKINELNLLSVLLVSW